VRQVQPFAVDASSRLEAEAGRKDPAKLDAFFAALRDVADVVQAEGGVGR
jgi:phosphoribosylanthranilate isomerase